MNEIWKNRMVGVNMGVAAVLTIAAIVKFVAGDTRTGFTNLLLAGANVFAGLALVKSP